MLSEEAHLPSVLSQVYRQKLSQGRFVAFPPSHSPLLVRDDLLLACFILPSFLLLKGKDSFLLLRREAKLNYMDNAGEKGRRKLHGSGSGENVLGFGLSLGF